MMCNRSVIIECPACGNQRLCEGGPSGFEAPYGIDYRDGGILSDWIVCRACDGAGEIEVPVELVDEDDLDEIPPPDPEDYGIVASLADGFEPLPADFAAVWDANTHVLYEA